MSTKGNGLQHPEVVPVFWGSYWNTTTNLPSRAALVGSVQGMVNGPYFAGLEQYGVGPARMVPTAPIYSATTPTAHCDNGSLCPNDQCPPSTSLCGAKDVQSAINGAIGAGLVPGPATNSDMLYIVFAPAGFNSTFDANATGTCDTSCGSQYQGHGYRFAWITDELGNMVASITHELAEAMTSNVSVANCKYNNAPFAASQIGDLCDCNTASQLSGQYQAYWSIADNTCVLPDAWSSIWQYSGTPGNWTTIAATPSRQVYAGGNNIMATDTNDLPYLYTGTPGQWTQIGTAPGAMYAVGSGGPTSILGISSDMTTVYEYSGVGENWNVISTNGASSVYAGASLLATDFNGSAYLYTNGSWGTGAVSGPADQFAVDGVGLAKLGLDHIVQGNVSLQSNGWQVIGNTASELFIGAGSSLAAMDLGSPKHVWYYQGGTSWVENGVAETDFAVTGNSTLFALTSARNAVIQSPDMTKTLPTWNVVGGAGGRLIGHGNSLYAVAGITY